MSSDHPGGKVVYDVILYCTYAGFFHDVCKRVIADLAL